MRTTRERSLKLSPLLQFGSGFDSDKVCYHRTHERSRFIRLVSRRDTISVSFSFLFTHALDWNGLCARDISGAIPSAGVANLHGHSLANDRTG